jgi:predicted secreted hydrolase
VANEWWYVVGHMRAGSRTFGFEATAFRLSHLHVPGSSGSAPLTLYRTDVAITDEHNHVFHQRITYYFPQSAQVSSKSLSVHVGSVRLTGPGPSRMRLSASLPRGSFSLTLRSKRPVMDVGGRGYLRMGKGYTYYYSLTDLAATGSIRLGGKMYSAHGIAWLDHQWGDWSWTGMHGWTWMAIQLGNGAQFSAYAIRGAPGAKAASILRPNGSLRTAADVSFARLGTWTSPRTGAVYPSGWILRVPSQRIRLIVRPSVRDQELVDPRAPAGSYWEGSGRVHGTFEGKPVRGYSYSELTGFARR